MAYVIAEPCIDVKDKSCVDECPVDCIYEGPRMLYIQSEECVNCDASVPVCPVTAIFAEDDVPANWKQFTALNAEWFSEVTGLGSPGGAAQVGPQDKDHPVVAGWDQWPDPVGRLPLRRLPSVRLDVASKGTKGGPMRGFHCVDQSHPRVDFAGSDDDELFERIKAHRPMLIQI